MKYQSILLKISGEAFKAQGDTTSQKKIEMIASEIQALKKLGIKLALVCGGGNVVRGINVSKKKRLGADNRGMKATFINIEALSKILKKEKIGHQIFTSFSIKQKKYPIFDSLKAQKAWQQNKVVLIGGGTGYPFFSTDTAAVLRSLELGVDVLVKATKVGGVYNADPVKNPQAKKYKKLTYRKYLEKNLRVMDLTAVALACSNQLPIRVIKWEEGNVIELVKGKSLGTTIN